MQNHKNYGLMVFGLFVSFGSSAQLAASALGVFPVVKNAFVAHVAAFNARMGIKQTFDCCEKGASDFIRPSYAKNFATGPITQADIAAVKDIWYATEDSAVVAGLPTRSDRSIKDQIRSERKQAWMKWHDVVKRFRVKQVHGCDEVSPNSLIFINKDFEVCDFTREDIESLVFSGSAVVLITQLFALFFVSIQPTDDTLDLDRAGSTVLDVDDVSAHDVATAAKAVLAYCVETSK